MEQSIVERPAAGELATPQQLAFLKTPSLSTQFLALGQGLSEAVQASVVRAGEFYLQNSEKARCLPVGTFGKINGKIRGQIDLVFGEWRPKAMLLVDSQPMLSSFNFEDPTFKQIMGTREVKKGAGPKTITPMVGTECLFFLPGHMFDWPRIKASGTSSWDEASLAPVIERLKNGTVCSFFFAKTNKEYSPAGEYEFGQPFTLRSDIRETSQYSWWVSPDRAIIEVTDANREWIEHGRAQLKDQIAAFKAAATEKSTAEKVETPVTER